MTTNKPEVLGYFPEFSSTSKDGECKLLLSRYTTRSDEYELYGDECRMVPIIRLSDYEALQAEYSRLKCEVIAHEVALSDERGRSANAILSLKAECERLSKALRETNEKS